MNLIDACEYGDFDRVKVLLSEGVDPSTQNNEAIRCASEYGHADVVSVLLSDPRVNHRVLNNNALYMASKNGHAGVVRLLLSEEIKKIIPDLSLHSRVNHIDNDESNIADIVSVLLDSRVNMLLCDNILLQEISNDLIQVYSISLPEDSIEDIIGILNKFVSISVNFQKILLKT